MAYTRFERTFELADRFGSHGQSFYYNASFLRPARHRDRASHALRPAVIRDPHSCYGRLLRKGVRRRLHARPIPRQRYVTGGPLLLLRVERTFTFFNSEAHL